MIVVLMGVAGAGKTTIGRALADALGWELHDADDLHAAANVAKMRRGEPLTDADRAAWLTAVGDLVARLATAGRPAVIACSALKAAYRRALVRDRPDVRVIYLKADPTLLRARLAARRGHFAGPALLPSQLATLEEPTDALTVDAAAPPDVLVATIRVALGLAPASPLVTAGALRAEGRMHIEVLSDADAVARRGAAVMAEAARVAVAARGKFLVAVSGGATPWAMLRALARENMPWTQVHVFQVDERVAPAGDPDRNLTHLRASLLTHAPLPPDQVHAMPVEDPDLAAAAARYGATLARLAGTPAVIDLVHLGLGPDGHTASLVPGDPALDVADADVAVTAPYKGHRRMTLTFPVLNRARSVLWLVTGAAKTPMLRRLREGDESIPAGRVRTDAALVLADRDASDDRVR